MTLVYQVDEALKERLRGAIGEHVADDVDRDDQVLLTAGLLATSPLHRVLLERAVETMSGGAHG